MKIKIFNREICVCALLATNSLMRKKRRRNGEKYERFKSKSHPSSQYCQLQGGEDQKYHHGGGDCADHDTVYGTFYGGHVHEARL